MPSLTLLRSSLSDTHKWILSQLDSPQSPARHVTEQKRLLRASNSSRRGLFRRQQREVRDEVEGVDDAQLSSTTRRCASVAATRHLAPVHQPAMRRSPGFILSSSESRRKTASHESQPNSSSTTSTSSAFHVPQLHPHALGNARTVTQLIHTHANSTPTLLHHGRRHRGIPATFERMNSMINSDAGGEFPTSSAPLDAEPLLLPPFPSNAQGSISGNTQRRETSSTPASIAPQSICMRQMINDDILYNEGCQLYASERFAEAFRLFRKIASRHAKAAYNCANMCRDGLGVGNPGRDDYGRCLGCMRQRRRSADSAPQFPPLTAHIECSHHPVHEHTEANIKRAIKYYTCAIKLADHPRAMFNLANLYRERGQQDRAVSLYKRACAQQHERSWTKLGNIYVAKRKYRKAHKCYEKGIEFGHSSAFRNMGICYEKGLGVSEDLLLARELYAEALRRKAHRAEYLLDNCERKILRNQTCIGLL